MKIRERTGRICVLLLALLLCMLAACSSQVSGQSGSEQKNDSQGEGGQSESSQSDDSQGELGQSDDMDIVARLQAAGIELQTEEEGAQLLFETASRAETVIIGDRCYGTLYTFADEDAAAAAAEQVSADGCSVQTGQGQHTVTDLLPVHWFRDRNQLLQLYCGQISLVQELEQLLGGQFAGFADQYSDGLSLETPQLLAKGERLKATTVLALPSKITSVAEALNVSAWTPEQSDTAPEQELLLDFMNGTTILLGGDRAQVTVQSAGGDVVSCYTVPEGTLDAVLACIEASPFKGG